VTSTGAVPTKRRSTNTVAPGTSDSIRRLACGRAGAGVGVARGLGVELERGVGVEGGAEGLAEGEGVGRGVGVS